MRVLVVDDDADFLLLARRALAARGHEVETTNTAFGLVNRVATKTTSRPLDIVVLDCDLPGLSGIAALELLGKDRRTSSVPVLVVSAAPLESHGGAVRAHPLSLFVQKDGHLKSLVEKLEQHVTIVSALRSAAR